MDILQTISVKPGAALADLVARSQREALVLQTGSNGEESVLVNVDYYRLLQSVEAAYWEGVREDICAKRAFKKR